MKTLRILNQLARIIWLTAGYSTVMILTLIAITITYTAIRGLPEEFQAMLRKELRQRGLIVDWDFVGLDPSARVFVRNFRCNKVIPGRESTIVIKQAVFDIGWLSLMRGEQLIRSITIKNASFQLITESGEKINIERLNGKAFITTEKIIIKELLASFGQAQISTEGQIPLRFFTDRPDTDSEFPAITAFESPETQQTDNRQWDFYAQRLQKIFDKCALKAFVKIFPRSGTSWDSVAISFVAQAERTELEGVTWEELLIQANWYEGTLSLEKLFLKTEHGLLSLRGIYNPLEGSISADLFVNTPPESLIPLLPEDIAVRLGKVTTYGSFTLQAKSHFHIRDYSATAVHGSLEWLNVTLGKGRVDEITIPFHINSRQIQIPGARICSASQILEVEISSSDLFTQISANISGSLNPALLEYLLPEAVNFFNSTTFKKPISLSLCADFFPAQEKKFILRGKASVDDMVYKGVEVVSASTDLMLYHPVLTLENLRLQRPEGLGTAQRVEYNYKEPSVRLWNVKTHFFTIPTARIFGPKLEEYLTPYILPEPPEIQIDGFIDLATERLTNLRIDAKGPIFGYHLFGRKITGKKFLTTIALSEKKLEIKSLKSQVDDGLLELKGQFLFQPQFTKYELNLSLQDADLSQLMKGFFNLSETSGRISGRANLSGNLENLRSMRGNGQVSIRNGSLLDIPFLGALSQVTGIVELGKARASEADATFNLLEGKIYTDDLEIRSLTMAVIGNGNYDFVEDKIELDVRLNVRGPAGLVLFPVSKLFEYRGTGTLAQTRWEPKLFTPAVPTPGSAQGSAPPVRGKNR